MSKTYDIDSFTGWVAEVINASKDPFVRSAQEMVNHFFELEHAMPSIYTCRYMDAESFRSRIAEYKADVKNSINLYWLDVARSLEAYGVMMMFRTNEVLRPAIQCLNRKEVVPAAILTRALLELAGSTIENANVFNATISQMKAARSDGAFHIGDNNFEGLLIRTVFGQRAGEDLPEYLKQKNILTTLQKLTKNSHASALLKRYEFLCELAHPNFQGFARFWTGSKTNDDLSESISIEKRGLAIIHAETVETILWGLGWSAACVRNGYHLLQETILNIDALTNHGLFTNQGPRFDDK